MKLVLLGTAGYHPNRWRQTSCFAIPEAGVVLDAGTGLHRLASRVQTDTLDIYLSHAHLDHVVGLTFLLGVLAERKLARLTVHGEADKLDAVERHLFSELLFPVRCDLDLKPLETVEQLAGGGRLTHVRLEHPGGSVGYRLDWPGHSLAYITDTTAAADAAYVEFLRGVDLLVHECNFRDDQAEFARLTGHSCATPVAEVARRAGVGRLLLVHLDPAGDRVDPIGLEAVRRIFPATTLGSDELVVEF